MTKIISKVTGCSIAENYVISGEETDTTPNYSVIESNDLKTLSVGGITIKPKQQSFSHSHPDNDEIYYFHSGLGEMTIGDKTFAVKPGDIVLCDGKEEHYITNTQDESDLYLTMIYNNKTRD